MICYDCDGRGWMGLEEFRDYTQKDGIILGDDAPLYFFKWSGKNTFNIGVCPSCEGYGK
jgi:hypothetical protein